jgi:hypothetical protein
MRMKSLTSIRKPRRALLQTRPCNLV